MSQLQSGSDLNFQTHVFVIEDQSQVGETRRFAASFCSKLNFDDVHAGRVSIIINELGANLVKYAKGGRLLLRILGNTSNGFEILAIDTGPGMENSADALRDGFTTGTSPGTGLGAVQRQSDEFDIYSIVGGGTIVLSRVYKDEKTKNLDRIGVVSVPIKGEILNGDGWYVTSAENSLDVLVVDGLGHGPLANAAALDAVSEFKKDDMVGITEKMKLIHARLRGGRGAAVLLARWDRAKEINYVAVGNIRAVTQSSEKTKSLITQNGTAGLVIPTLKEHKHEWVGDGFFILHSDGINNRWDLTKHRDLFHCHPAIVAAFLYRDFSRGNDDSTVVVLGGRS